jgi:hypothetical protein
MLHTTAHVGRLFASTFILSAAVALAGCGDAGGGSGEGDDPLTGGLGGEGGSGDGDVCEIGDIDDCTTAQGLAGLRDCVDGDDGPEWTECAGDQGAASTPLVLAFAGERVQFGAGDSSAFDLAGRGMSVATDWPAASTPWLALDRNGNGRIDDGSELFGSAALLASGAHAANGFQALAELDDNGDGRITPADAAWSRLTVWSDADADRRSSGSELAPLSAFRLTGIELGYSTARLCDARGNCEIERAGFRYLDASGAERTGAVIDVHLKFQ